MSFDIIFYKNRSEPNRLDKTSYLDRYTQISGVLRNSTSIISPTIDIQFEYRQNYVVDGQGTWVISDGKKVILATIEELLQCNYCYIEAFKRYYYITDIVSVRQGLWSISMSVDVLMSYKDIIKQQRGIVARNEFDFNNLLNDTKIVVSIDYNIDIIECDDIRLLYELSPPDYEPVGVKINGQLVLEEYPVILTVVGDSSGYSGGGEFTIGYENPASLIPNNSYLLFANNSTYYKIVEKILAPDFLESLFNSFVNYSDYIVQITTLPFNSNHLLPSNKELIIRGLTGRDITLDENGYYLVDGYKIYVGLGGQKIEVDNAEIYGIGRKSIKILYSKLFDNIELYDNYLDYPPYTEYELYIPYYGLVPFNIDYIKNGYNYLVYLLDITSGDFICGITNKVTDNLQDFIEKYNGNMGASVGIGSSNQNQIHMNNLVNSIRLGQNLFNRFSEYKSSTTNLPRTQKGGVLTKKSKRILSSSKQDLFQGVANDFIDYGIDSIVDNVPTYSKEGSSSNLNNCFSPIPFFVKSYKKYEYPVDYNHLYGRPLMENRSLGELNGYTEISDIHLENFGNATSDELSEIESILLSGIIL